MVLQLNYIEDFLDLADTLSFTRSAENLCEAQSTLSRHIADLERQVGARLFDRTSTSVRLTRAGKKLYQTASAMQNSYANVLSEIKGEKDIHYKVIKCGGSVIHPAVTSTFTALDMMAVSEDLPLRFEYGRTPALAQESPSYYSLDMLRNGDLDLVVEPQAPDSANLEEFETHLVARESYTVVVSQDNPLVERNSLKLEDLVNAGQAQLVLAVYKHCPQLLTYPFRDAGLKPKEQEVVFIGDILEIAEYLAKLEPDQFVLLQNRFCANFGFVTRSGGCCRALDMDDDRLCVRFWSFMRRDESGPAAKTLRDMIGKIEVVEKA